MGIVSVAAAVGAGHLVAALVAPATSPPLAVADAVVRLAPPPLVEFANSTFGTADKPVLLAGIAVMLAAAAALAGLASRRRSWPAVTVIVVLGLLSVAAVWTAPAVGPARPVPVAGRPRRRRGGGPVAASPAAPQRRRRRAIPARARSPDAACAARLRRARRRRSRRGRHGRGRSAAHPRRRRLARRGHPPARRGTGRPRPAGTARRGPHRVRRAPGRHLERRLLPDRHGAARPGALGRRLEPAGPRHGRPRAHALVRRSRRPSARRAHPHSDLRLQRGGRRPRVDRPVRRRRPARRSCATPGSTPTPTRSCPPASTAGRPAHRPPSCSNPTAARCSPSG